MKSRTTAGILALFFGGLGVHKFYLDRPGLGIVYFLFCWTFIPSIIAFFEAIMLFTASDESFNAKYNHGVMAIASPQNIVVNVANTATSGATDRATQLRDLHNLLTSGALSTDEYDTEKRRVLSSGT
ncbi:MAG: TM2 domain-containing protein [Gemmatimonadaceae bacterium]